MFSVRSSVASVFTAALLLTACTAIPMTDEHVPVPAVEDTNVSRSSTSPASVLSDDCPAINADPPTSTVTYVNVGKGISFDIPYNDQWGYAESPLSAYTAHESSDEFPLGYVLFGSPTSGSLEGLAHSCDVTQSYELTFLPVRTAATAQRTIEGRGTDIVPNVTVHTINGFTVVQYKDVGLCNYPTMEVVGKSYNYSFTTSCGGDVLEEWKTLESTIKSIKLTK